MDVFPSNVFKSVANVPAVSVTANVNLSVAVALASAVFNDDAVPDVTVAVTSPLVLLAIASI